MYTIGIDEIEEGSSENIEIVVAGVRRITISLNKRNTSVQIPGGFKPTSISNSEVSFFGRTRDIA